MILYIYIYISHMHTHTHKMSRLKVRRLNPDYAETRCPKEPQQQICCPGVVGAFSQSASVAPAVMSLDDFVDSLRPGQSLPFP